MSRSEIGPAAPLAAEKGRRGRKGDGRRSRAIPPATGVALAAALLTLASGAWLYRFDPESFWRDDYQSQQLAGYLDAARAWRAGELPLLSRSSWNGAALLGEYQVAVFSPAVMLPVLVMAELGASLRLTAAVLSVGHLAILAAGCSVLARQKRLPADLCLLAAVVGTLNGYQLVWGGACWFPELASFAWLPWAWWALERSVRRPGALAWLPPGLFLALILLAGWPFSVLMIALVTLLLVARHRLWRRGRARLRGPLLGWATGLGLSAPAWLALIEFFPWTLRGQASSVLLQFDWMMSPRHLPALLFPGYRTPLDQSSGPATHFNVESVGGLVPFVVLAASRWTFGSWRFFGRFRGEAALAALACALSMLPGLGPFRWSFRWLALVYLAGGLAAAGALDQLRRRAGLRPNLGLWALAGVGAVWLLALARNADPTPFTARLGAAMTLLCLAWAVVERSCRPSSTVRRWAPAVVAWAGVLLFAAGMSPFLTTPSWPIDSEQLSRLPREPGVRYWSVYTWDDIVRVERPARPARPAQGQGVGLLPANLGMYTGADVVQGYSPLLPLGLCYLFRFEVHGQVAAEQAEAVLREHAGPGGMLEAMAVDGLLLGEKLRHLAPVLRARGWRQADASPPGAVAFRRVGPPSPRVRALPRARVSGDQATVLARDLLYRPGAPADVRGEEFAPVRLGELEDGRNTATVHVEVAERSRAGLVVFSRPWFPGYRAHLDGRPVPVEVRALVLPAVRLPPGASGTLVLEYRPWALTVGGPVAVLTAGLSLAAALVLSFRGSEVRPTGVV